MAPLELLVELLESRSGAPGTSDPMEWSPGELARTGEVAALTGEIRRKLRAVISCQHAVKDNRDDNQLRLAGEIEVVVSA